MDRLSGPMIRTVLDCASIHTGIGLLDDGLALGRQVQAATAAAGRRIHGEWPSASRRFRLRDSVDFSMSSEWPISTAVMPSCWASWVSSVNWLAVIPSGRSASS